MTPRHVHAVFCSILQLCTAWLPLIIISLLGFTSIFTCGVVYTYSTADGKIPLRIILFYKNKAFLFLKAQSRAQCKKGASDAHLNSYTTLVLKELVTQVPSSTL